MFRAALGPAFDRLHPMLQRRFGVSLAAGYSCVGRGTMTRIRRGPWWTVPFLQFGRVRRILVADTGDDVPFLIENYPYRDPFGRETVTFVREYRARRRPARFDATMVFDPSRGIIVDYLGTHQHLAVDLELDVDGSGGLVLRSGAQRFYEGPIAFRFPMLFSGYAELHERYDDERGAFHVRLEVRNRVFGFLFGYEGWFTCEFPECADAPERLKPRRHERRL
ncbi:DUF4166 domain-containing protein [Microbacterium marinilacus]|nr:DUF4166 domain-containing protein [Microbacterium marinilacus]